MNLIKKNSNADNFTKNIPKEFYNLFGSFQEQSWSSYPKSHLDCLCDHILAFKRIDLRAGNIIVHSLKYNRRLSVVSLSCSNSSQQINCCDALNTEISSPESSHLILPQKWTVEVADSIIWGCFSLYISYLVKFCIINTKPPAPIFLFHKASQEEAWLYNRFS